MCIYFILFLYSDIPHLHIKQILIIKIDQQKYFLIAEFNNWQIERVQKLKYKASLLY